MKNLILSLILLTATSSFASVFQKNSALPYALQAQVIAKIKKNCPDIALHNLVEVETSIESSQEVDGVIERTFRTNLLAQYAHDSVPSNIQISIESAEHDQTNINYVVELLHLSSSDPQACAFF